MIPRERRWSLHPLAVGLLVHAPEPIAEAMSQAFLNAELVAQRNCAEDTPAERAMHVAWLHWTADHTDNADLAGWLRWAARLISDDWGMDAAADIQGASPFPPIPMLSTSPDG